ncbi:MAG: MBL fold metallo-hydrolase [Verrucomicrobia bacterium]|nr:MBL fold metallo-hydrolase [Verrucomicrobiota bacterium]
MDNPKIKAIFWGVRGSIPCPGPATVKYGGNTPSIELRFPGAGNRLIIIDAGSGIRELGNYLMTHDQRKGPIKTEIYLSHTHWDHISGFPFFTPIYVPGSSIKVFGPKTHEHDTLEQIVGGQFSYRYFPIRGVELAAKIEYAHLQEGCFDLGDGITLLTKYLNHPILCLGYRFEHQGKVFCTAFDTEPFRNLFCSDPKHPDYNEAIAQEGEMVAQEQNEALEKFFAGADLLIYDAQYTQEEYAPTKLGWGHTPIEYACEAAARAGVKALALFHHDPMRTDQQLDTLAEKYCHAGKYGDVDVFFASEGREIAL